MRHSPRGSYWQFGRNSALRHSNRRKRPRRPHLRRSSLFESLESRTLLTATVTSVDTTALASSAHKAGDTVGITVKFSELVNVTGAPKLALNSGGTAAALFSGG